jgi:hypothetical protein
LRKLPAPKVEGVKSLKKQTTKRYKVGSGIIKKIHKRLMAKTIIRETKKKGQRKVEKRTTCKNQKKGES